MHRIEVDGVRGPEWFRITLRLHGRLAKSAFVNLLVREHVARIPVVSPGILKCARENLLPGLVLSWGFTWNLNSTLKFQNEKGVLQIRGQFVLPETPGFSPAPSPALSMFLAINDFEQIFSRCSDCEDVTCDSAVVSPGSAPWMR